MKVTIHTDASMCPRTGAAAWAMFASCSRGHMEYGAVLTVKTTSTGAEAWGIIKALEAAINANIVLPGDQVVFLGDSVGAQRALQGKTSKQEWLPPPEADKMAKKLGVFREKLNLTFKFEHVKAHMHVDRRNEFHRRNALIDRTARKFMRRMRDKIDGKKALPMNGGRVVIYPLASQETAATV